MKYCDDYPCAKFGGFSFISAVLVLSHRQTDRITDTVKCLSHTTGVSEYSFSFIYFTVKLVLLYICMCRGRLSDIAVEKWQIVDDSVKQNLARMASTAAWGLG